jgi:predicted nuclease of restriction endonuclease-like (RecB) superfamily
MDEAYSQLLDKLRTEIKTARVQATVTVNVQLLGLYWRMGRAILEQQQAEGWGARIIDRLSGDLRKAFPDMKGISPRNLKYMRAFAEAYPEFKQATTASTQRGQFVQPVVAQIPWAHNVALLDRVKSIDERLFYAQKTLENGWSRNVLVHQIESGLYQRQGKAVSNFQQTLPSPQSDLAREMLKDPYKFDFLQLTEKYVEKDLEDALTQHITKFLLELGAGFTFAGRQYHLEVGGKDFYIDLLFYHLKLRCFVVIELKTGEFIPEYASKLNFYLNVVDDQLRHQSDNTSIGILICKERNKIVAEYALRGMTKPIGVAEYELVQQIPEALKGSLPTIEEIEQELQKPEE